MSSLSPEQRRDLDRSGDRPIRVEDPETREEFVLLRAAAYERLLAAAEEEIDPSFFEFDGFEPIVDPPRPPAHP